MTKRDVLAMALKVGAVYSALRSVGVIPHILGSLTAMVIHGHMEAAQLWSLLYTPWSLFLAYLLLRWSEPIAAFLIKQDAPLPSLAHEGWEESVFRLSLRVVGAVSIAAGARDLMRVYAGSWRNYSTPASGLIAIVLGAYLLSGARHLVAFSLKKAGPASGATAC